MKLVFIVEEFFREDLGGLGGLGKIVESVSRRRPGGFKPQVFLARGLRGVPGPRKVSRRRTDLFLVPAEGAGRDEFLSYLDLTGGSPGKVLVCMDFQPSYRYPLAVYHSAPLIIWLHAPKDEGELRKMAAVPLELESRRAGGLRDLLAQARERRRSFSALLGASRGRKILLAVSHPFLAERARRACGFAGRPHVLPSPIELPPRPGPPPPGRPSLCFIGRLDPVKRPWIVFELARRLPGVDFLVAGESRFPHLLAPLISRYRGLTNLRLLGRVSEGGKARLLERCWGLINASVTEGLPVSFQESFAHGRCVISSQDPGGLVERFGYFTGEIRGDGMDRRSLERFSGKILEFLSDRQGRLRKGRLARAYAERNFSFERFEESLGRLLRRAGAA